jgi:hypothetical protein
MQIVKPDPSGKPPWSPTVVNVMRAKTRRRKRAQRWLLIFAIAVLAFGCIVCGTQINRPKQPAGPPAYTATVTMPTEMTITLIVKPGWTPVPGNPLIGYRVEPITK